MGRTLRIDDGFDWETWLEGRVVGPPPELARHERIAALETEIARKSSIYREACSTASSSA